VKHSHGRTGVDSPLCTHIMCPESGRLIMQLPVILKPNRRAAFPSDRLNLFQEPDGLFLMAACRMANRQAQSQASSGSLLLSREMHLRHSSVAVTEWRCVLQWRTHMFEWALCHFTYTYVIPDIKPLDYTPMLLPCFSSILESNLT